MNRDAQNRQCKEFFEELWGKGDPWELASSDFEKRRYEQIVRRISDRRYGRVLEIGCGVGDFTRHLTPLADSVVGIDISATAIERARLSAPAVDFQVANVIEFDLRAQQPWDLTVMMETIYYIGWLYSFFDVGWLASELFTATRAGGRLLLSNTQGCGDDMLMLPLLIRTYRDLFINAGFRVEHEETTQDSKHGVEVEVLTTLLIKDSV